MLQAPKINLRKTFGIAEHSHFRNFIQTCRDKLHHMKHTSSTTTYSSECMTFSPDSGEVSNSHVSIKLTPVNMRVLVILLENQQQVITRREFIDQVWEKLVVGEDSLTRCISELRTQLGSLTQTQKLIETLPKQN